MAKLAEPCGVKNDSSSKLASGVTNALETAGALWGKPLSQLLRERCPGRPQVCARKSAPSSKTTDFFLETSRGLTPFALEAREGWFGLHSCSAPGGSIVSDGDPILDRLRRFCRDAAPRSVTDEGEMTLALSRFSFQQVQQ